jgi:hypothetical protein
MQDTQSSYIFAFDGKPDSRINRQGASSRPAHLRQKLYYCLQRLTPGHNA